MSYVVKVYFHRIGDKTFLISTLIICLLHKKYHKILFNVKQVFLTFVDGFPLSLKSIVCRILMLRVFELAKSKNKYNLKICSGYMCTAPRRLTKAAGYL